MASRVGKPILQGQLYEQGLWAEENGKYPLDNYYIKLVQTGKLVTMPCSVSPRHNQAGEPYTKAKASLAIIKGIAIEPVLDCQHCLAAYC